MERGGPTNVDLCNVPGGQASRVNGESLGHVHTIHPSGLEREFASKESEFARRGKVQSSKSIHPKTTNSKAELSKPYNTENNYPDAPAWDNTTENIDEYTPPPPVLWTDSQVEAAFTQEPFNELDLDDADLNGPERLQLQRLVLQYRCLFEPQKKTVVRGFSVRVDIKPGAQPVQGRVYRQSFQQDKTLKLWLDKAEKEGLIEPSTKSVEGRCLMYSQTMGKRDLRA